MSYKEQCTKGPVEYSRMLLGPNQTDRRSGFVVNGPEDGTPDLPVRICDLRAPQGMNGTAVAKANASLIAEAFNVLHETGMTPRELAEALIAIRNWSEARNGTPEADDEALRRIQLYATFQR